MFADDSGHGIAQETAQLAFGFSDGLVARGEFGEERGRVGNSPTGIDRGEECETVTGEALGERGFEVLDALIELVDPLDGPRPLAVSACLGDGFSGFTEGGHHGDFGLADLEDAQEQEKDDEQQEPDNE